jgi:histidinol dehydrogenase
MANGFVYLPGGSGDYPASALVDVLPVLEVIP